MSGFRRLLSLPAFRRRSVERDVDAELAFHLAQRAARLAERGLAASEADHEARRRFGDLATIRGECVDIDWTHTRRTIMQTWLEDLIDDARFGVRSLRRSRGLAVAAILTLAFGITAVTTVFSFVNAAFRPLPYADADRIVRLQFASYQSVPLLAVPVVTASTRSFDHFALYRRESGNGIVEGTAQQIRGLSVDTGFAAMLRTPAAIGRFPSRDEIASTAPVAAISHKLWERLGADSAIVGRSIRIDDRLITIVGVMPPRFDFPGAIEMWRPLSLTPDPGDTPATTSVSVLARLKRGVSHDAARLELAGLSPRLNEMDKSFAKFRLQMLDEMVDRATGGRIMQLIGLFLGAATFVLLIVCGNVANLMLVRAAERKTEMAVRASLGAGRWRLVRQHLTESLILATTAGVLGTFLTVAAVKVILALVPTSQLPQWLEFGLDVRVLLVVIAATIMVAALIGSLPMRITAQLDISSVLKAGGRGAGRGHDLTRGSRSRLAIQLALSVALFTGAALFARSYQRLTTIDLGYPAERIISVHPVYPEHSYHSYSSRIAFAEGIVERLNGNPLLESVGVWSDGWIAMGRGAAAAGDSAPRVGITGRLSVNGTTVIPEGLTQGVRPKMVSESYFKILGVPLVAGRLLDASDVSGSMPVAVVSREFARRFLGEGTPLGKTITFGVAGRPFTVVGVVENVRGLDRPTGGEFGTDVYLSSRQVTAQYPQIIARARGDVGAAQTLLAGTIANADPNLPLGRGARTLADAGEEQRLVIRIFGTLFGFFAIAALVLCVVGIYGVVAYGVTQRTTEIGIRMALGGTPSAVIDMLVREGLRFTVGGVVVGLVIAVGLSQLMRSLLWGTSPLDPAIYGTVAILFGGVAWLACYLPARRAAAVDPLVAMRAE